MMNWWLTKITITQGEAFTPIITCFLIGLVMVYFEYKYLRERKRYRELFGKQNINDNANHAQGAQSNKPPEVNRLTIKND